MQLALLFLAPAAWANEPPAADVRPVEAPTVRAGAEAVRGVVWAQPFRLVEPARYLWSADGASFDEGWILQLHADPAWLVPRQVAEPVLFVGPTPAARLHVDVGSACAVVFVPGEIDWTRTAVFFGLPELPERIDAAAGEAAATAASHSGARAVGTLHDVLDPNGPILLEDLEALHRAVKDRGERCRQSSSQ